MIYSNLSRAIPAAIVLAGLLLGAVAATPAEAQGVRLDVQGNVSPENTLYFEGTVTPRNLSPGGRLQVRNELDLLVEVIGENGRFRRLPNSFTATSEEAHRRGRLLEGEDLEGRDSELFKVSGQVLKPEDQGERFGISGTVDLGDAARFRIIARLRHTWVGSWPAAECSYDIAGPFPVREGVARKRRGGGFLGDVGRFLERSITQVGRVVVSGAEEAGKFVLGTVDNPISLLQILLLGDLEQRSGAFGPAIKVIGGASGAGLALLVLDQIASGDLSVDSDNLTQTLVEELLAKHSGDALDIVFQTGEGFVLSDGSADADAMIAAAIGQLQADLGEELGLRNLRVDVDDTSAIIASQMPSLDGRGHLEPIIAYMLVDAALTAPWTEVVTAVFSDEAGGTFGITAPAEAARSFARGEIDTEGFLQLSRFANPSELEAAGVDPEVAGTEIDRIEELDGPVAPGAPATESRIAPLLAQSRLPSGWLASPTHPVEIADLDRVIPGIKLSNKSVRSASIQVIKVDESPVTLLGLRMPDESAAEDFTASLADDPGGDWEGDLLHLSTEPPLQALHNEDSAYLLQGEEAQVVKLGRLIGINESPDTAPAGLESLLPETAGGDPPQRTGEAETSETEPVVDEAVEDTGQMAVRPDPEGYLANAYLCTGVDGSRPQRLTEALPVGADRLGVYLDLRDAPAGTLLNLELWRDGSSMGRRLMAVSGDRRAVTYFIPDGGFSSGSWWLEISAGDQLLARLPFEVQ